MSLINDALKRVKEAQQKAPPPATVGPQFRPVDPPPAPAHKLGLLLPIALAALSLLALLLVWMVARKNTSTDVLTVRAEPAVQENASGPFSPRVADPVVQSASPVSTSAAAIPVVSPASGPAVSSCATNGISAGAGNGALVTQAATAMSTNASDLKTTAWPQAPDLFTNASGTNLPAAVQPDLTKSATLKLQGIVFSKRPSAVINGRTLFVGDRIREFRIVAISAETATLVGGGRTNVLSFSE